MKVAAVGVGYVGLVAAACLADAGNDVMCVDNDPQKIDLLRDGEIPIYEPGLTEIVKRNVTAGRLKFTTSIKEGVDESLLIFIGVGTPSAPDGSADISAVLEVAEQVAESMTDYRIIVTKSTVPVGTHKLVSEIMASKTDHPFDYVSNPEFLKEGSAVDDFLKPDRVIIGTENPAVREIMKQLYAPFMRKSKRIIFMDPASAEMAKYAANVMLATRISFMNELSGLCDTFDADIEQVRRAVGSDSRIGSAFLFPGVGYGGSCFPKDVRALTYMGDQKDCPMTIAQAVRDANYHQQDRFADRVLNYFKDKKDITIAAWGLAFKAKTDDTRESPAVRCIQKFLDAGFKVNAYDPEAKPAELEGRIKTTTRSYDALENADALVIFTDWQEFRNPNFDLITEMLNSPVIFDGRNLYDPSFIKKYGIEYHSIGRPTA
ncbi:UDP-glucose 6-dehydrogenase TuaD [Anaerohalosphaera lusitana]|uniref:UDP-glucose 6-dehydrogenase n=1 Tax=Anaerohalosphaera lusitana TaxID=1936003 RepID=A0A1U9NQZ0_9BACT|nr:UDP-glucose/GDP-mannose dehydrogenase family protein [Anaerohalosphaera lusitana]AQT70342.1 UDP-glucose 6-dehydrogenase TuaD [Anaerohalosphaera lusitana]